MIVDGRKLHWWWVTNKYDVPLAGVAYYEGYPYRIIERHSEMGNWLVYDPETDDCTYDPNHLDLYVAEPIAFMTWWRIRRWWWINIKRPGVFARARRNRIKNRRDDQS